MLLHKRTVNSTQSAAIGSSTMKIYAATLLQDGTPGNPPTITEIKNTIGTVSSITYTGIGTYRIIFLNPELTLNKTLVLTSQSGLTNGTFGARRLNGTTIAILTNDSAFVPADGILSNDYLYVEVYN